MAKNKEPDRRKRHFIKKGFQLKFILKFCTLVLIGVVLSTALLFLFSQGTLTSSFQQSRLVIKKTAFAILPMVIYTNLITLGLITIATIAVILFVSHKIAGPLFRFEKDLKDIAEGDLTKVISLRKKDQMTDMADNLNKMTASLHDKVLEIRKEVESVMEMASKENVPQEIKEPLKRIHERIGEHFKV